MTSEISFTCHFYGGPIVGGPIAIRFYMLLTHISKRPFCGAWANSGDPDQTPQNAASDQGLNCFLAENSIEIWIKMKNSTQQPFKRKWTAPQ